MTPPATIKPDAYTDEYFLTAVEGHQQFRESNGRRVSPRLSRALELANPYPGQRILDVGCGRGEIVLQSALRGADAVGIDYAQAAMEIARKPLIEAADGRGALARMDATSLAFRPETFDAALMLDFVEHVPQAQLERAFEQLHRALKPGGRLIIHTSPNRTFEEVIYPHYVCNVHRAFLNIGRFFSMDERFFNEYVLPLDRHPPHDAYQRKLHINTQTASSMRAALKRAGFRVRKISFWEAPQGKVFDPDLKWCNFLVSLLNGVRFLRPFSRFPPLNRWFSNNIWVVAERRG